MADKIDELVQSALARISPASSLEDISKAVEIAKTASENARTGLEIRTSSAQLRFESLKTWASILVPAVSLLALVVTIVVQSLQLQATRQQAEDSQWRDLLSSLHSGLNDGTSGSISDVSLVPRLRSFFNSPTYGQQAIDLSKRIMGKIVNYPAFQDLFGTVFPSQDAKNVVDLLDINKILYFTWLDSIQTCGRLTEQVTMPPSNLTDSAGICSSRIQDKDVNVILKDNAHSIEIIAKRRQLTDLNTEMTFISNEIFNAMRRTSAENSKATVKFAGAFITGADGRGVDFSSADLSSTVFNYVNLANARLTPKKYDSFNPQDTQWWEVAAIDQGLLEILINNYYPGYFAGEGFFSDIPLTKEYYAHRIASLCQPFRALCEDQNLRFASNFVIIKAH